MKSISVTFASKILPALLVFFCSYSFSQIAPGVYMNEQKDGDQVVMHRLVISEDYLVHSVYQGSPAKFIRTYGGFHEHSDGLMNLSLEFNSDFEKEGVREMEIRYSRNGNDLIFGEDGIAFKKSAASNQDLDGFWLFATRGPDTGQERRGDDNPRKTLKVLVDGTFQWIAYHTETFKFSGTGGGSYTSGDGTYKESIGFFSRDDSRVGAVLEFQYEIRGNDWHHTGKNSRGEPLYEIWSKR